MFYCSYKEWPVDCLLLSWLYLSRCPYKLISMWPTCKIEGHYWLACVILQAYLQPHIILTSPLVPTKCQVRVSVDIWTDRLPIYDAGIVCEIYEASCKQFSLENKTGKRGLANDRFVQSMERPVVGG